MDSARHVSRMNLSGYVGHVTIFNWMFTIGDVILKLVLEVSHPREYYKELNQYLPNFSGWCRCCRSFLSSTRSISSRTMDGQSNLHSEVVLVPTPVHTVGHVTIFSWMFTIGDVILACLVVKFYAHVFVLLSVVIVTLPGTLCLRKTSRRRRQWLFCRKSIKQDLSLRSVITSVKSS